MNSGEGDMVDEAGRSRGSGRLGMSRLGALFEIDLRSLALLRIGVALALLVDLASRVRDMDALYAARGILPPALARSLWDRSVTLSPFTWVARIDTIALDRGVSARHRRALSGSGLDPALGGRRSLVSACRPSGSQSWALHVR